MSDKEVLFDSLADKEYRELYVSEIISSVLAAQIRALREGQEMTQADLGVRAGMAQESISKLENPNYGRYSLTTLKRLASGLDVALVVRFAGYGELSEWIVNLNPDKLAPPSYEQERHYALREAPSGASTWEGDLIILPERLEHTGNTYEISARRGLAATT